MMKILNLIQVNNRALYGLRQQIKIKRLKIQS